MKRIVSHPRIATGVVALLVLVVGSVILLQAPIARAFTIIPGLIFFDPVSVTPGQTVHVHVVNKLSTAPIGIFVECKPTTPGLGATVTGPALPLALGAGTDQSFSFASFAPTPGTTRIPFVCTISFVGTPPGTPLPFDWSARVASSVEIIDDATGRPTEIATTHHVVNPPLFPCVFCN